MQYQIDFTSLIRKWQTSCLERPSSINSFLTFVSCTGPLPIQVFLCYNEENFFDSEKPLPGARLLTRGIDMYITCLDLEGVLVPEIWIAFAEETGIPELRLTTRDISDYDVLMKKRLGILEEHQLGLKSIQATIARIDPLPGAKEFLDQLRRLTQVVILSDTFTQFAAPLMEKLGMPTIFCNELVVAEDGRIVDYRMRQDNGKLHAVRGFQSMGYDTIAAGDSFNDLAMITASQSGFLFRSPDHIIADHPQIPAFTEYNDLLDAIRKVVNG